MSPDLNTLPRSSGLLHAVPGTGTGTGTGALGIAGTTSTTSTASLAVATSPAVAVPSALPSSPPSSPPPLADTSTRRPNILYIMADQLAAPLLRMHNPDSQIHTPNIDALATRSVQFDSAYCASPLCAPSRMSMMTGLLPMRIGAYDNAAQVASELPTYAHYLRLAGYHTALAGKMHFVGDQLHGFEDRLTSDIYPGDFGWAVNWDEPERRLEWYHNASSVLQAGTCVRSNQLDYDEEVMYRSTQYLYNHVRQGPRARPFCLTVSLTHPHDPYTIEKKYWDLYDGVDIDLPRVRIPRDQQDPHSARLLRVCDLWDQDFTDDQVRRARRAYYGAVSYVDDCIGRLLHLLRECHLDDDTIVVFAGDHGDMLGERGLWYKMSFFENSARVPLLIHDPRPGPDGHGHRPHRVPANVSTLDILPTLCDLVGVAPLPGLPLDGVSLLPHLRREPGGSDTVIGEYAGEGTISPLMMIRRGDWKFVTCPTDGHQLFNLGRDPLELVDWAKKVQAAGPAGEAAGEIVGEVAGEATGKAVGGGAKDGENLLAEARRLLDAFVKEAADRWDFAAITEKVLLSQRTRRLVWSALRVGRFTSWDFNAAERDDGRSKYIRSHIPLDDLERMARFPAVDALGREVRVKGRE